MEKLVAILLYLYSITSVGQSLTPMQVYDRVSAITTEKFYDRNFRGLDWPALVARYPTKINDGSSQNQVTQTINALLLNLHASHTEFLTNDTQEFHGLRSIFSGKIEGDQYFQAGGWYKRERQHWFIKNVFPNTPLSRAGLQSGDEMIAVDDKPFQEINSFNTALPVTLTYKTSTFGPKKRIKLVPELKSVQELLLSATLSSKKIFSVGSKRVGYLHLWSGTHDLFLDSIRSTAADFANSTDAMILDLRDGFGGAWTPYIQPFFNSDLDTGEPVKQIYSKALFILINDGVRSGKEYLAFVIKQKRRGVLIGTYTAGHFLAGGFYNIIEGVYSLFLAEAGDSTGQIEGRGVAPDILVPSPLPYSHGDDPELRATLGIIDSRN